MNIQSLWNGFTQFQHNFFQKFQQNGMKNVAAALQKSSIANSTRQQAAKKAPDNLVRDRVSISYSGSSYGGGGGGGGGAISSNIKIIDYSDDLTNPAYKGPHLIMLNQENSRLFGYDTTEDEAIWRQMQQNGPPITPESIERGDPIKLGAPTRAELDAYRELLRTQGGNQEINWGCFALELNYEGTCGSKEITNKADYFASRYVAAKGKLDGNFTGEELTSRLEKLDELYGSAVDKMAREYAESTAKFYEENGFAGETEKIYQSILVGTAQRRDELTQFAAANSNYAGLDGSVDEWLKQDDSYMAMRLRAAAGPMDAVVPEQKPVGSAPVGTNAIESPEAPYTLRDIDAAAKFVQELPENIIGGVHSDEESFGLDLAILTIKTQVFTEAAGISEGMQSLIRNALQNYQENALNAIDEKLLTQSQDGRLAGNAEGCPPLDRDAIKSVYNKTMETYKRTGSFAEALKAGGAYGYQKYMEKSGSKDYNKAYRYTGKEYWEAFYTQVHAPNPYYGRVPTIQLYQQNWNSMIETLKSGDISAFQLGLSGLGAIPNANVSRFGAAAANWANGYDKIV